MIKSDYNLRIKSFGEEISRRIDKDYAMHFLVKQNLKSDINYLTEQFLEQ